MHLKTNKYLLSISFIDKKGVSWQGSLDLSTLFVSLGNRLKAVDFSQIIPSTDGKRIHGQRRDLSGLEKLAVYGKEEKVHAKFIK